MIIQIRGEVTRGMADEVLAQLSKDTESPVEVHIDSMGGDLFAGLSIYNALDQRDTTVFVDGIAGSIASVIALSGKERPTIAKTGFFAIHNAQIENVSGDHNDLLKAVDALEKYSEVIADIYIEKTELTQEDVKTAMDIETQFNAKESLALGFAGSIGAPLKAVAHITNIDMSIIDKILKSKVQNNLAAPENVGAPETMEPSVQNNAEGEETPQIKGALTEEDLQVIANMISEAIAASQTQVAEEVGNSVAEIMNNIKSTGVPPAKNQIPAAPEQAMSFEAKATQSFFEAKNKMKGGVNNG